ncbi:restriction endonuclease [Achromobacter sp. JUb104]|uniref:restriction endonuclease n=1 Tax=Achromobacter sp. JUb104 TaxID=2940590 RepID=UPI0021692CC6|nr:restriction endonuclease [Achromobacter sp. JUb104]MCS3505210.1 hypothetical protein [Achromobacter sp. JUb104]
MRSPNQQALPQEWPEHLAEATVVHPVDVVTPIGQPLLDFSRMDATTFEQFCWWLLKKDQALVGCKRLGQPGTEQHGIDIIARDENQPDELCVFECKAWKDFGPSNLTQAIEVFLAGNWVKWTRKFTLILAQQSVGRALVNRWKKESERLKQAGIEAELWTAHTLTLKVQLYPDILTKFFPWASVEHHANLWMQRVGFYELVSKTFFDPTERVRNWARELAAQVNALGGSDHPIVDPTSADTHRAAHALPYAIEKQSPTLIVDGKLRTVHQGGNYWNFKGPWFSLSALLPAGDLTRSSAAITFNKANMKGLTLTFDHKWLLRSFLSRTDTPLKEIYRGFIVGEMPHDSDTYLIDFPHCRFALEREGVREIAWVADMLGTAILSALRNMEANWSARDFPLVEWAGRKVALAAISVELWNEIGKFSEEHDVSNGTTHWHMFDGNNQVLKPYHDRKTELFDAGYHGVFYAVPISGLSFDREVILLWQPNNLIHDQEFSPRTWWACDFALKWLTESLLPEIKRRIYQRRFKGRWQEIIFRKRAKRLSAFLDEHFTVRSLCQRGLSQEGQQPGGPMERATVLQRFFHAPPRPEPYILQEEMVRLYQAAALIAKGGKGYPKFACSKLLLHGDAENHLDLIRLIHEHVQKGGTVANSAVADNVFRAILELLGESDEWLLASDREEIQAAIEPFARIRDEAMLIERHTRWS